MGYKCCVPGCRSNYDGEVTKYLCFSFPKDECRKQMWAWAIPKKDYTPKPYAKVCERHFKESDFEYEASAYDPKTGVTITAPLNRKRLKKDVIPSVFPVTSDSTSSGEKISSKKKKLLKSGQSNTVQNRLKWLPAKNSPLKNLSAAAASSASRSPEKKREEAKEMVKRKRKSTSNDKTNKKAADSSELNDAHSSNDAQVSAKLNNIRPSNSVAQASEKSTGLNNACSSNSVAQASEKYFENTERFVSNLNDPRFSYQLDIINTFFDAIKEEPLSDGETPHPFKNNPETSISKSMQITNVKSLSNESIAESPSEEEHATKETNESFDNNFYSKPLDMDQRDKAFGSFVACELSDLRQNSALYMKAKQSILKILTEAHFEQMSF